ncbi:MAG TPA: rod shape-determining protein MreC [Acidimicrobiales bacterium]|nr:rod shape-determining protein MreC [Acidimicrobiales bacterium]
MAAPRRTSRARFVLALLVLTAVTLLTLDVRSFGPIDAARRAALAVLAPVRGAVGWVIDPAVDAWNGAWGYDELRAENDELRARLDELVGADAREASALETVRRFLEQADVTYAGDIPQVVTRVVSGPVSSFEYTVTIDKGTESGIREGMAAVTAAGLVGRVERATDGQAIVQLISDPRFGVGARVVSSQALGLVEGRGRDRDPRLEVPGDEPLAEGDLVETSGLDRSLYPPNVPIGRVVDVSNRATGDGAVDDDADSTTSSTLGLQVVATQQASVDLHADLGRLSFLTVLLWEPAR